MAERREPGRPAGADAERRPPRGAPPPGTSEPPSQPPGLEAPDGPAPHAAPPPRSATPALARALRPATPAAPSPRFGGARDSGAATPEGRAASGAHRACAPAPPRAPPTSSSWKPRDRANRSLKGTEAVAPGLGTRGPSRDARPGAVRPTLQAWAPEGCLEEAAPGQQLQSHRRRPGDPGVSGPTPRERARCPPGAAGQRMQTRGLCTRWATGSSQGGLLQGARLRSDTGPGCPAGLRRSPRSASCLTLRPEAQINY
ncbi:translation initiation factor IF-2-like [Moschus berezovskii]|uniref:translation initiation factor IF-2-like n=1 Tax=Moschus berezovskii TaxID=68408 RepID=UPI002443B7D6|nr:translation initiation factor IF-2-like [Moschus berezovskii]